MKGIPLWPWGLLATYTVPMLMGGLLVWYGLYGGILFGDVDWYSTGLARLLTDGPLYDPAKLSPHPLERPPFWDQAPSTALITLLLLPGNGWVWGLTMSFSTFLGLALVWPRVGIGGTVLLAPVLILLPPVTSALFWGNVNGLVFCLLAAAWRFPRMAGLVIGVAAAIKLTPILGVAWLAGRRDWRGLIIAIAIPLAATALVLTIKGPSTVFDFVMLRVNQWTPSDTPSSLTRWGLADLGLSVWVGYGLAAFLAFWAWRRASFSLAVIAMLVGSPALHIHYWTWLLVPVLGVWIPWFVGRIREQPTVHAMNREAVRADSPSP